MTEIMKGITCCADCAYYNAKKHRCTRATDEGKPTDHFYADCPLPTVNEVQGWVSVKDKLPENKAVCLTYSPKGKMRVAEAFLPSSLPNSKFDPMECWWSTHGSGGARYVAVTHWMPLPEPPKEDA